MNSNSIEWVFEKIFDKVVDITMVPYHIFSDLTWDNYNVLKLISSLTRYDIDIVRTYLSNDDYRYRFCCQKSDKITASIMMDLNVDCRTYNYLQEAVKHNRLRICKEIIKYVEPKNELLSIAAKYGYQDIYFWLRSLLLMPNLSVYMTAVQGSVEIVKDVDRLISPNDQVLEKAFEYGDEQIVRYLYDHLKSFWNHYVIYHRFTDLFPDEWRRDYYYSAILSGDLDVIEIAEKRLGNIHENMFMDHSRTDKGRSNIIMDEITYRNGSDILFSHCINYAVQSRSLHTVQYIHSLGYNITLSNIITAIKQSTTPILSYLLDHYNKPIPIYVIHYLSVDSYINDKQEKIKIIAPFIDLDQKLTLKLRRKESTHLRIIANSNITEQIALSDTDYLLSYCIFFHQYKTINEKRELAKIYISIRSGRYIDTDNKRLLVDILYLYSSIKQIKQYDVHLSPSIPIIMELISYRSLSKLCHLVKNNLMPASQELIRVVTMLDDNHVTDLFNKI